VCPLLCKECGWEVPSDLIQNLLNGQPIYCEKCGFEINPTNLDIEKLKIDYKELYLDAKIKAFKFAKNRILKPLKKKYDNFVKKQQGT